MPFGEQRYNSLEGFRRILGDLAQGELTTRMNAAEMTRQMKARQAISGVLQTYTKALTRPGQMTRTVENPQFGGVMGQQSVQTIGPTSAEERVIASQAFGDLLSIGTPESQEAAKEFASFRKITQPPHVTNELEALIEEHGGDVAAAERDFQDRQVERARARRAPVKEDPYQDFRSGYPDTPQGRKQAAEEFIKLQTQQKIKQVQAKPPGAGASRRVKTKTKPGYDNADISGKPTAQSMLVWHGVDSQGQPFTVYPRDKITWAQWMQETQTQREKTAAVVAEAIAAQLRGTTKSGDVEAVQAPADTAVEDIRGQY